MITVRYVPLPKLVPCKSRDFPGLTSSLKKRTVKSREFWQNRPFSKEAFAVKTTKFTGEQIEFALRQAETGIKVAEVCRKMGIYEAPLCNWKEKCGGLGVSELCRLKQLEEDNRQLKKLVANLRLDKQMLQDVLKKSSKASPQEASGRQP